jgi:hypothetical protein
MIPHRSSIAARGLLAILVLGFVHASLSPDGVARDVGSAIALLFVCALGASAP